jgi:hypothetical protein
MVLKHACPMCKESILRPDVFLVVLVILFVLSWKVSRQTQAAKRCKEVFRVLAENNHKPIYTHPLPILSPLAGTTKTQKQIRMTDSTEKSLGIV